MPRLLYSPASPYSAKVRMAAVHTGYALESETVDTNADPEKLLKANPLGKIPCLVTDEGDGIHDSRVIMQYIGRETGNTLYPRNAAKRLEAERLEAIADGICDCLLAHVY